jgi:four helix bundle protein
MVNVNYKNLTFFKKGHEITLEIYKITKEFPKEEQGFSGLVSQLRRASSSICANVAEGSGRSTIKDYRNFLHNALGSAKEIEYFLLLAKDLNYFKVTSTYDRLLDLVNIIIGTLTNYMKQIK